MGVEKRIKERMSDAVVRSYYRPWYKRGWGKALIIFLAIVVISGSYLAIKVGVYTHHIKNGEFYDEDLNVWLTQDQYIENLGLAADLISGNDPWLGTEKPIINVVAYESFGCPYCDDDQSEIRQMLAKFSSVVRFTAKDFPTEALHPGVFEAHLAAACANEQGHYWEYRDELFANQGDGFGRSNLQAIAKKIGLNSKEFDQCLIDEDFSQEIRQDYASGVDLGVVGTPSYIINGVLIEGSLRLEQWEEIIGFILKGDLQI